MFFLIPMPLAMASSSYLIAMASILVRTNEVCLNVKPKIAPTLSGIKVHWACLRKKEEICGRISRRNGVSVHKPMIIPDVHTLRFG